MLNEEGQKLYDELHEAREKCRERLRTLKGKDRKGVELTIRNLSTAMKALQRGEAPEVVRGFLA